MKFLRTYFLLSCICFSLSLQSQTQTVPGTLSSPDTVCAYSNSGVLQLTGYTGTVLRWEYSLNGSSLWTTISNVSDSYNYIDLFQTTYFRAVVQLTGSPEAPSNVVRITVDDTTKAGYSTVLSGTECTGNTVKMTLHDYKGSILKWQYSTNNASTWYDIAQSNDSINKYFTNIAAITLFRATVKNGVCAAQVSDSVQVIALPKSVGGNVSGSATVCQGSNGDTLHLTGHTGTVIRWESSPTGMDPWATINNTTTNLVYANLTSNTHYRAVIKSGNCDEALSTVAFIAVDKATDAGFISGTQTVCGGVNTGVLQVNANNGTILQWEFSTNGGTNWTTTAVNANTYTFTNLTQDTDFRVQIVNGVCPSVYTNSFHVTVKPIPAVSYTFTQGCQGKSVSFTNTTTGANLYNWDFNDGNGSSVFSPTHIYLTSGVFQVKLTATSTNGCSDSLKKNITIYAQPSVNFSVLDSACGFKQLLFTNNSGITSGVISSYVWNFGDNTATTAEINPSHTYSIANTYKIKLVATSDMGCKDSIIKPVEIFPKPVADYITSNVCKKTAATFTNTSYINGGGIFNNWSFGDSQVSTLTSPTHLYSAAGNYNVRLITISNHNCMDTVIKAIRIQEQPDLTINTNNVCLTKTTSFTQSINPAVPNYKLNWNFGNGDVANGNNPTYVYPVPGTYTVTASITTDSGCVTTATKVNTIYPLSKPLFSVNNTCDSDSVTITNQSSVSTGSMTYFWNFGNNTTSNANNPKIKYETAANYFIKLVVTTDKGCKDSLSKAITIYDSPVTNFDFKNACDGKPVEFTNTSTVKSGTITITSWNFGDNSNSTLLNPTKLYDHFGDYPVTLQTVSSNGCRSSIKKTVSVYEGPIANFSFINQCLNKAIPFTNLTTLTSGTYDSFWDFGDLTTSPLNSPEHLYQLPGTKKIKLIVSTRNGCKDSISKTAEAFPIPTIFAGNDTTISNGYSVQLKATGGYTYAWSPAEGLNNPTLSNPIANPYKTTEYIVEGTSINGCSSKDAIVVTIEDDFLVIPYNIVTPDGNGKNDTWVVRNIERYPKNKISILDEWGVMVYEQSGYENNWEGRNSRGEILPDGTYFYVLTFEDNKKIYKGFITVLRNK